MSKGTIEVYWELKEDKEQVAQTFMSVIKAKFQNRTQEKEALDAMLERIMERLEEIENEEKLEKEF